jgi:hypothetical protein
MASRYTPQVVAVIDTASSFGATVKQLKDNVTALQTQVSTLLADAPETLDTLNEIAAAISDDPAFFTTMATANTTLQNNIDTETTNRTAVVAALQALIDAATTARGLLSGRLDALEADATTGTALAAVQADVDQNETDGDAADAALSARIATLEADPTTKTYVDTQVTNVIDAAPGALDTLNELAAALGDDANFATTITNSIAAVQADVDQNETDADAAIAAVQADVDQNEADADAAIALANTAMLAAVAAVQADVDANEADHDAAVALRAPLANPAFTGTTVSQTAGDTDPTTHTITGGFPDLILKTNQGDFATHQNEGRILWDDAGGGSHGAIKMKQSTGQTMDFFVGGVTAGDKVMSIASDSVDVESLKIDGTAVTSTAAELNQLDGITLGTAAQSASGDFATAAQGAKADSALQSHQDISGKANLAGGTTFTGNVSVAKNWPDLELKSGDEKRLLFSDAGGNATAGLKHVSGSLDFYVGGIAGGNKEMSLDTDGLDVTALKIAGTAITSTAAELNYCDGVTSNIQTQLDATVSAADTTLTGLTTMASAKFSTVLPEYSNDSAAATGGVPVGGLYRTMQLVKIRVS